MVNRFRVNHGAIHRDWPPGEMDMVTASDYDALAGELAACKRQDELHWRTRKSYLDHIAGLEAALRKLIKGYVNTLESGAIAIQAYGGKCDSVEVMEAGDPHLIEAKAVLASALETDGECKEHKYSEGWDSHCVRCGQRGFAPPDRLVKKCQHDLLKPDVTVTVSWDARNEYMDGHCSVCGHSWHIPTGTPTTSDRGTEHGG